MATITITTAVGNNQNIANIAGIAFSCLNRIMYNCPIGVVQVNQDLKFFCLGKIHDALLKMHE